MKKKIAAKVKVFVRWDFTTNMNLKFALTLRGTNSKGIKNNLIRLKRRQAVNLIKDATIVI